MELYKSIVQGNEEWVKEKLAEDPEYFQKLSVDQKPNYLWIGCSDSRVPANVITKSSPGEVFVHRNVGNLVVHTDFNLLAVLQYAVDILKVPHIVVCGHYGCGGINAAISHDHMGLLNGWLRHIKDVYHQNEGELRELNPDQASRRLVELNVREQVRNLAKTSIVQNSWKLENIPHLHGWVFDMQTGKIKEVFNIQAGTKLADIYEYEFKPGGY